MPNVFKILAAIVLFAALAPQAAHAQLQTGNLFTVTQDESGAPLAGATITLTGIGPSKVQISNAQGEARFLGLAPGSYAIEASLEGYSTLNYPNIPVNVGRNTSVELTLSAPVMDPIDPSEEGS